MPVTSALSGQGALPRYSVAELNEAVGTLLERGFAPRFLLDATVSRPQLKKGHLWLTLTDGDASISAVIWASQLQKLGFVPEEGDGVVVVGKLNFWAARANLSVQVLDLRPSLTAVLRQFEWVRDLLMPEGLFDPERKRPLPELPGRIALLTSVPSSALADMLRTARERWPSTRLLVVPIPVQGPVEQRIRAAIDQISGRCLELGLDAIVLARGGGSREDLAVFDGEALARSLASCPVPVVCGLGHEDDTTIADLVADYRAATPTAALVALLPDRQMALQALSQERRHLGQLVRLRLQGARQLLERQRERLAGTAAGAGIQPAAGCHREPGALHPRPAARGCHPSATAGRQGGGGRPPAGERRTTADGLQTSQLRLSHHSLLPSLLRASPAMPKASETNRSRSRQTSPKRDGPEAVTNAAADPAADLIYGEARAALELCLAQLQASDLDVETMADLYRRALAYADRCEQLLNQVEQDVMQWDPEQPGATPHSYAP
jgi:exodeoxyribonuclease VII large subunit